MPTRNINLTEHYDQFVAKEVKSGHYNNASEVFRAGLHLLQKQEEEDKAKLEVLRAIAAKGTRDIAEGRFVDIPPEEDVGVFLDPIQAKIEKKHQRNKKRK